MTSDMVPLGRYLGILVYHKGILYINKVLQLENPLQLNKQLKRFKRNPHSTLNILTA